MTRRSYDLGVRAEAMRRTRETILDVAVEQFSVRWYDEVTLADVARQAGVSQQTVINHFGGKAQLYLAGVGERVAPEIKAARESAVTGDVESVVAAVCADYEATGDSTVRMLALADRLEELAELARDGRERHREWVASMFPSADPPRLVRLAVVLDVRTWHQLRREARLGAEATRQHVEQLVRAVLGS